MKLPVLHRKLWRELWQMRGQALAILLVIVAGVGVCVMSVSTYDSLQQTRDRFYRDTRFAHLFASLTRAPEAVAEPVTRWPEVAAVETRITAPVSLTVPGFGDPVTGQLVSMPDTGQPQLNRLEVIEGQMPGDWQEDEVLISDAFAEAHRLHPGSTLTAVLNGRQRVLHVTGIAISPEFIYQIAPGAMMPDYRHFGVLWMPRKPLAKAFNLDGAFNSLVLSLQPQASEAAVVQRLDLLLARWGGIGVISREDQLSNKFLSEEFEQLRTMAWLFPVIFLSVAAFLLNVVVTRLVSTQRPVIALLKAFGYSSRAVAVHYGQLILIITGLGILGGFALGAWLGKLMTGVYTDYYRFPELIYNLNTPWLLPVALLTLLATLAGTARAVLSAAAMPPAESMRPEPPERYRLTWLERIGLRHWLGAPERMILRHWSRRPARALLAVTGMALAVGIMMVGNFQQDAVQQMMFVQFHKTMRQDVEVVFSQTRPERALGSLRAMPGVLYAEGQRSVAVRLRHGHLSYRTALQGMPDQRRLQQVLDLDLRPLALPDDGLLLNEHLALKLGVKAGDSVRVEVLEGGRPVREVRVAALSQQYMGMGVYLRQAALNRLLREGPAISSALLAIDDRQADSIYQRLREMPGVAAVNLRHTLIESFNETMQRVLLTFTLINAVLGAVIAFGVVYNTVRMALAERSRELASLRVLGYTRQEAAYILLGELAALTLLALPLGVVFGVGLCQFMAGNLQTDLYRIPLVISPYNIAFSAAVVVVSAVTSGVVAWRKIAELDMVGVLKSA